MIESALLRQSSERIIPTAPSAITAVSSLAKGEKKDRLPRSGGTLALDSTLHGGSLAGAPEGGLVQKSIETPPHERRLELLFQAVVDFGLYILSPDGRVVSWNPAPAG